MSDPVQEQLFGHLFQALDDDEQASIEARLNGEPDLWQQYCQLRRQCEQLEFLREELFPPDGLARRTCQFVDGQRRQDQGQRPGGAPLTSPAEHPAMSPERGSPSWVGHVRWVDVAVAVGLFLAAMVLLFPALQSSRFDAHITACQENLRQIGVALTEYSARNGGYFPSVPAGGNTSAAGIYAPVLFDAGFLKQAQRVICPGSSLAGRQCFRVPRLGQINSAGSDQLPQLRQTMGGSYGYSLGYMHRGQYHSARKNLRRPLFAIMADAPSVELPELQSLNHGGKGQNVLFEDGHVDFLLTPRPQPINDHFFTNDNGLVAAGVHPDDAVIGASGASPVQEAEAAWGNPNE